MAELGAQMAARKAELLAYRKGGLMNRIKQGLDNLTNQPPMQVAALAGM